MKFRVLCKPPVDEEPLFSLSLLLFLSAVPFSGDDVFVVSLCAPSTREGETKDAIGCGRRIWGTELKEIL